MAVTIRRPRTAATPGPQPGGISQPATVLRGPSLDRGVVIDATAQMQCVHQFVGYPGFLRCARCEFRVSQLPLSKPGAIVLRFRD